MDENRILPEWVVVVFAILGMIGSGVASTYAWFTRQRDKERAKQEKAREKEEKRYGLPFPQVLAELKAQLQTVTVGFGKLQHDHAECRENLARQETRVAIQEDRILQLEREVESVRKRLGPNGGG